MKFGQWYQYRRHKLHIDWSTQPAIDFFRLESEAAGKRLGALPKSVTVEPVRIDGIRAEWLKPTQETSDQVMLFFHGGGYVAGSCDTHRIGVAKMVKYTQTRALLFDYRLAPENPYPAALEDAIAAYQWLLDQGISAERIVFAGDSAGGGLCLATLLALKQRKIAQPTAVVVFSPWTDLTGNSDSIARNQNKCLIPRGSLQAFSQHYAAQHETNLPLISPLFGELQGLPRMLIFVGGDEVLLDDAVQFSEKARSAGVEVTLVVAKGLFHCYPYMAPLFPEARRAVEQMREFIRDNKMLGAGLA